MADDDYEDDDQDTGAADYAQYQPQQYRLTSQDDSNLPVMSQADYMRMYGGKTYTPPADDSNLPVMSQADYMRMYGGQAQQPEERADESELGAGLRSFAHSVLPTVAGAVAGTALGTAVAGPFGTIPGFLAGIGGGAATGYAAGKAQEATLSAIGMDDSHTLALNAQKYPWATAIGGALPAALTFQPGAVGTTLAQRAGQAGLAGAIDVGSQYAITGDVDPRSAAVSAATGFLLPGTRPWVERAAAPGAAAMRPWVERFASQRAAADAAAASAPAEKPAVSSAEPLTPEQKVSPSATSSNLGDAEVKPSPQGVDTDAGQGIAKKAVSEHTGEGGEPPAQPQAPATKPYVDMATMDPAQQAALRAQLGPEVQPAAQPQPTAAQPLSDMSLEELYRRQVDGKSTLEERTAATQEIRRREFSVATPLGEELRVGDFVQWSPPSGGDQFETPRRIASISPDGRFAFVEGSNTGLPIHELFAQPPASPRGAATAAPPPEPQAPVDRAPQRAPAAPAVDYDSELLRTLGKPEFEDAFNRLKNDKSVDQAQMQGIANRFNGPVAPKAPRDKALAVIYSRHRKLAEFQSDIDRGVGSKAAGLTRKPLGPQRGPRATRTEPLPIGKEQAILEAGARRVEEGVPPGTPQPPLRQGLGREPVPPSMNPPGPPPSNPVPPKGPPRPPGTPPGSPKDTVPPPAEKSSENVSRWLHDMLDWLRRNRDSDLPKAENDIRDAQQKAGYPVMGWLQETAARLHPYFRDQNDAREQRLYRSVEDRDDSVLTPQDKIYKQTLEDAWSKEIQDNRARVKELQKADGVPAQDDDDEVGFIRRLRKGFQGDQSVMGNDDPLYGAAMRGGDKGTFRERVFHGMTAGDGEHLVIGNVTGGKSIRIFKPGEEPVTIDNPYEGKTLGQLHGEKLDYNGKEYTIGNTRARDITAAVPEMQYHESYTASRASELMQTRETLRQAELFHDIRNNPDHWGAIRTFSKRQAEAMKPQPWEQTDVPGLKGVYFDPLAASALNRVYKMQPESWISKLNDIAVSSIFLNPVPHTLNEAYHWAVGRGEDWLKPSGYYNLFKSGGDAITSLLKRDDDYVAALQGRAPMVNAGRNRSEAFQNIAALAGLDIKRNPHQWDILASKFGFRAPGELIRSIFDASASAMWTAGDLFRLQRIKELKMQGMTTDEAIREMARHQPDYRLPLTVMGSPKVAEFLAGQNYGRLAVMFTRYHYTVFNSLADMVKNAAVGSPDERRKAIGHLMVLGLLAYVAKPYLLDPLARMITGNPNAEFRPRGPLAPLAAAQDYAAGKKDIGQAVSGIVTPTPVARLGSELFTNRDWAGRQIVNPMSSAPDQLAQALEHLAQSIISPYSTYQGTFLPGGAKGSFANELRDQFLDIKEQTARQKAGQAYGMRQEKSQAQKRAQRPAGLIEYGTRQLEQLGR